MGRLSRVLAATALAAVAAGGTPAFGQVRSGPGQAAAGSAELPGAIRGTVVDEHGSPVPGALVSALGATEAVAETDELGRFILSGLRPDAYTVRAHLAGVSTSGRARVRVAAGETAPASLALQSARVLAGVGTGGILPGFVTPTWTGLSEEESAQLEPTASAEPAAPAPDSHSETAWRLRHARRSVLKDTTQTVAEVAAAEGGQASDPWSLLGRAVGSPARMAGSYFAELPWSGEVTLLTTTSFDAPQDLFSADGLPRGVAYLSIGAPAGARGQWVVQGAMTQGDVSSWILAGSYSSVFRGSHAVGLGMSYSTQIYDGAHAIALAESRDRGRNVGAVYGSDHWSISRSATATYGARYARYDYLPGAPLFSPHADVTLDVSTRTRLKSAVSQAMLAPGAEEFLPPAMAGVWLPPERTFSPAVSGAAFRPARTTHVEAAVEHDLAAGYAVGLRRFHQRTSDQLVTLFGVRVPEGPSADFGHYFVAGAGAVEADGWAVKLKCDVANRVRGSVEYSRVAARWSPSPDAAVVTLLAPSAVRSGVERFHDLTTSVETDIPETATRVFVLYRLNSAFSRPEIDAAAAALDGRIDVRVHQGLPFAPFANTQWEVLVAVRNFFREAAPDGSVYDELLVVRPPKRIVGGLLVRF